MHLYRYLRMAVIAILLLGLSCTTGKPGHVSLRQRVSPGAWRLCDSLTAGNVIADDPEAARVPLFRALRDIPEWKDSATYAWLLLHIGEAYGYSGLLDSLEHYCVQSLAYFERHPGYILPLNMCYSGIGFSTLHLHQNAYKANYYCTKAAALCLLPGADTLIPDHLVLRSLSSAASSNRICHLYGQALRFSREAYTRSYAARNKWQESYVASLIDMANIYVKMSTFDSAYLFLRKAEQWNNDTLRSEAYKASIFYGWSTYYYYTKQFDSSLHYARQLSAVDSRDNRFGNHYNLALLHCMLDQGTSAKQHLDTATMLLDSVRNDAERKGYLSVRTLYNLKYGDRKEAARSFLAYEDANIKFYNQEHTQIASSIESAYNLADKQKNLDRLHKVNENAKRQLQVRNGLLIITGLLILLSVVVIVVLLLLSRQRKLRAGARAARDQHDKIALEQRLLRTQMEPHFIFNTLAAMQYFIREKENDKAALYLNRFSRLLRDSLEHSRENFVLLSEEIAALENYMSLQAMQSEERFTYSIRVYEGYEEEDIRIPPMLFQPFVENALQHGLRHHPVDGHISVVIEKGAKVLDCRVTDNGAGLMQEEAMPGKKSLAMQITKERLEALGRETRQEARLEVLRRENNLPGTIVHLVIPFV